MTESICMVCGMPTVAVRPGKHQCLYCEALADNERLRAENERLWGVVNDLVTEIGQLLEDRAHESRQTSDQIHEYVRSLRARAVDNSKSTPEAEAREG